MKAFHFTKNGKLRDGRPLPAIGEELRHKGEVVMCGLGLHASRLLIHALLYAPGLELHVVNVGDVCDEQNDKFVCRSRTIEKTVKLDFRQVVRFALESACLAFWVRDIYSENLIKALNACDSGDFRAAADAAYAAAHAADAHAAAAADAAYDAAAAAHAAAYAAADAAADAAYATAYAAHAAAYAAAAAAVTDCLEQRAQTLFGVA